MKSTANPACLSLAEARAIAVRSQGLAEEEAPYGLGKAGVLRTIGQLGYVQVDTISVLQRAHHHVIQCRVPDYRTEMLHQLQTDDVSVYEYWNHATSFLTTRDYRFSLPLMRKFRTESHWGDDTPELQKAKRRLLARVRDKGPLRIGDVESKATHQSGYASVGKIERTALHELWMRGDLMIRSRQGMEKIFDLPGRVLPAGIDLTLPSPKEAADFHIRRALNALGVARAQELTYLQDAARADVGKTALQALVKSGEAVVLRIGDHDVPAFALHSALTLSKPVARRAVRFLSPFDNLVIQRKRLQWLFDFEYVVEIYLPAAKRKYGYFVLPILWGDRLVGRMDAKAFRLEKKLVVHNLVFEPLFRDFASIKDSFRKALHEFMEFQGCSEVEVTRVNTKNFKIS